MIAHITSNRVRYKLSVQYAQLGIPPTISTRNAKGTKETKQIANKGIQRYLIRNLNVCISFSSKTMCLD